MKKQNRITLYKLLWCKIRFYQRLHSVSDDQLAKELDVHVRTLKEYDKDAQHLTLGRVDGFLFANNISLSDLINS